MSIQEQNCEGNTYVCPIVREITHCSTGGIPGYTTYELSLQVINEDVYNIYALFGDNTLKEVRDDPSIFYSLIDTDKFITLNLNLNLSI